MFVVDSRFFRKFVVDARKFVVDALCKILWHNVLCYAIKVTKKKLKITVKQWGVSFWFIEVASLHFSACFFDTTSFWRMGASENR